MSRIIGRQTGGTCLLNATDLAASHRPTGGNGQPYKRRRSIPTHAPCRMLVAGSYAAYCLNFSSDRVDVVASVMANAAAWGPASLPSGQAGAGCNSEDRGGPALSPRRYPRHAAHRAVPCHAAEDLTLSGRLYNNGVPMMRRGATSAVRHRFRRRVAAPGWDCHARQTCSAPRLAERPTIWQGRICVRCNPCPAYWLMAFQGRGPHHPGHILFLPARSSGWPLRARDPGGLSRHGDNSLPCEHRYCPEGDLYPFPDPGHRLWADLWPGRHQSRPVRRRCTRRSPEIGDSGAVFARAGLR